MSTDLIAAATHLADTLAEENAALAALDLPRAAAMLPRKQQAVAAFTTALAWGGATEPVAQRLRSLADENKVLLERAIAAQGRVIAVFARAAAPPPRYGASRGRYCGGRPVPFALAAQA